MEKQDICTTTKSRYLMIAEVESHLTQATVELRAAWALCKQADMGGKAKEIAGMVLDLEKAAKEAHEENVGADDFY